MNQLTPALVTCKSCEGTGWSGGGPYFGDPEEMGYPKCKICNGSGEVPSLPPPKEDPWDRLGAVEK